MLVKPEVPTMVSDAKMILAKEGDKSASLPSTSTGPRSINQFPASPHLPSWSRPPLLSGPNLHPSLLQPPQLLFRHAQAPTYTSNPLTHTTATMRLYPPGTILTTQSPIPRADVRWGSRWVPPVGTSEAWRPPRHVQFVNGWSPMTTPSQTQNRAPPKVTSQQSDQPTKAWQLTPPNHPPSPSSQAATTWSSPSASVPASVAGHSSASSPMTLSPTAGLLSPSPNAHSPTSAPFSPPTADKWDTKPSGAETVTDRSLHSSESFRFNSSTDDSSSSSSDDTPGMAKRREDGLGSNAQLNFVGTVVPLKESDEELYLDPGSQKYIPLSQWISKNGEEPRESLRKGATVTRPGGPSLGFKKDLPLSSLPEPKPSLPDSGLNDNVGSSSGWPVSEDGPASPGNTDNSSGGFGPAFADQVAMQNKLLQASRQDPALLTTGDTLYYTPDINELGASSHDGRRTVLECHPGEFPSMIGTALLDTLSPASPNPEPSGPSDLGDEYSLGHPDDVSAGGGDDAVNLLGSVASFGDSINEDSARAAMEEAQRQRGLAAKIDVISHVLTQREEDARQQLNSSQQTSDAERRELEAEIARLRAEAAQFRKQAEEEQRKREEERKEIIARIEALKAEAARSVDPQINEMLQKQEQMQQIIEKMMQNNKLIEAGVEYIPHERHGVTAVQFQILRCGPLIAKLSQKLQGSILPYAIVKIGNNSLTSRLEHSMSVSDLTAQQDISWNDLFTFPYLNERYLSVTIRIKENRSDQRQYDHLIGSARIDLEVYIINPHMCGSQMVQLFDEEGQPTVAIQVGIQTTNEVTHCAFLAMKPKEMTPSDALLTQSLTSAFFEAPAHKEMSGSAFTSQNQPSRSTLTDSSAVLESDAVGHSSHARSSSQDSLEEVLRVVDFRALEIVAHPWRSLRIVLVGARGIKLGSKTPDTQTSFKVWLVGPGEINRQEKTLQTSIQPIRVTQLKKKRLFATATFNEECRFPYSMEKTVMFEFLTHTARDDVTAFGQTIGVCQLSLQRLLMTKLNWFKRRLSIEKPGGVKRVGHLDIILHFLAEPIMCCSISPSYNPIDTSFYTNVSNSACISENVAADFAWESVVDVEVRDAQLRLAEEAAENLPDPSCCQVTIECGRDLNNPSLVRQMEPYVKVKLGNFEARTTTATTCFPKWRLRNGQFSFALDRDWETQLLTFECYHASLTGRDKLVGITLLPLADLKAMPSRYFSGEVTLLDKLCRIAGYLQLSVQLSC